MIMMITMTMIAAIAATATARQGNTTGKNTATRRLRNPPPRRVIPRNPKERRIRSETTIASPPNTAKNQSTKAQRANAVVAAAIPIAVVVAADFQKTFHRLTTLATS